MKPPSTGSRNERRRPLPRGEALLVGAVALLISVTILFFAVSTSRPSEPSHSPAHYGKPGDLVPRSSGVGSTSPQLSHKEKIQ